MITLGIETSCDETALSLIETRTDADSFECRVIDSLVHSQAELHSAYGGVYPNLAKREHGKNLVPLLHKLMVRSSEAMSTLQPSIPRKQLTIVQFEDSIDRFKTELEAQNPDLWQSLSGADFLRDVPSIDRIAVTEGPGLEPTLWVGINFARILGTLWSIPIIPVNHMEGHVVGSLLESDKPLGSWQKLKPVVFPALSLLISGGHTELVRIDRGTTHQMRYTILGQTVDDAVGEAFDKVARLLGLSYPGGPHISRLSKEAEDLAIPSPLKLPRPMLNSGNLNFSFSGMKTAVLYATRKATLPDGSIPEDWKRGMAHEFELAVAETLNHKLKMAIDQLDAKTIIIGGGVSANNMLRERFTETANEYGIPLYLPSRHISGDNALMIALVGAMDSSVHPGELKAEGTKRLGLE